MYPISILLFLSSAGLSVPYFVTTGLRWMFGLESQCEEQQQLDGFAPLPASPVKLDVPGLTPGMPTDTAPPSAYGGGTVAEASPTSMSPSLPSTSTAPIAAPKAADSRELSRPGEVTASSEGADTYSPGTEAPYASTVGAVCFVGSGG